MPGFTKLDCGIVDSSIWGEPYHRRIVWITFLAKADYAGIVRASVSGVQRAANVTMEEVIDAIKCLESPDTDSRSPEFEGRRIEKIEGGWKVLNHARYRAYNYSDNPESVRKRIQRSKTAKANTQNGTCPGVSQMSQNQRDISASALCSTASEGKEGVGEKGVDASEEPPLPFPEIQPEPNGNGKYHPHSRIALHWLNEHSGRHQREVDANLKVISARLNEPDVTIEGVKRMITRQCRKWKGTTMEDYLRVSTLFGKEKFDSYYSARDLQIATDTVPKKKTGILLDENF